MNRGTNSGANILVVDDTVENLRLLAGMLGDQGYEVRPVTTGRQALQAVERDPPDLILLDINMPEMNGYEVCARLKQNPALKDVPVIFLTALGDVADKVKAFDVGGIDYITKPFQLEEVQARVRTHVALRRAGRELTESYERLRALEKLRDDLVHMVVHDMRSPLMVMLGHLQLLRQSSFGLLSDEATADLTSAVDAAKTLTRMSNDLLDVSRIEAQKMPLDAREHDLSLIARTVHGAFGTLSRDRSLELAAESPVPLRCDGELVRRVLENLVGNAIKHTPSGGAIRIAVTSLGAHARAEVVDDGPGIPSEARERIFEKFGTVAAKKDQAYHSVGLGLAFCKLAVEAHGGRIGVDMVDPHGSVFWLELPL
jgi:two-component system, sensor histidine kinase and response regulator